MKGISKSFGDKQVITSTDLEVPDGCFTTLLGPSGCGKTTLLRMIAGLETPDTGEIMLDDRLVYSAQKGINLPPEKRGLGFVFQDFALWPHMTVYGNTAFSLKARKAAGGLEEKVTKALRTVHLEDLRDRYPHQLSGGQQQRVAFARAIASESTCILFDEPLSALDALLREEMRREIKELVASLGTTAIFVTHDQSEAMTMSDRIAVVNNGKIEQLASPEELYNAPKTRFVAKFIGKSNWLDSSTFFRPEAAKTEGAEGDLAFTLPVSQVQYLGASYEIALQHESGTWFIHSRKKARKGQLVSIYINPRHLISLGEEE